MPRLPKRSKLPTEGGNAGVSKLSSAEISNGDAIQFLQRVKNSPTRPLREANIIDEIIKALECRSPKQPIAVSHTPGSKYVEDMIDFRCPNCDESVEEETMFYPSGFYCPACGQHIGEYKG